MKNIKLETRCGDNITSTIKKAIRVSASKASYALVEFDFNGVIVVVKRDSDPDLVYRDWSRALSGYIPKTVGPDYKKELSSEETESDAKVEARNEARRAEQRAKWQAEADAKRAKFDARLEEAPEMSFSDKAGWDEWLANQGEDGYGKACFQYAQWWARLMELEMLSGKKLKKVAEKTSREADVEGITGFMYGMAVSILAKCWKYGDELRRWHNLDTQIGNEGEVANEEGSVLNPAVLNISDN